MGNYDDFWESIFGIAEKIESSAYPDWIKWSLYILLILLTIKLIYNMVTVASIKKEEELNATKVDENILATAMEHKYSKKVKK